MDYMDYTSYLINISANLEFLKTFCVLLIIIIVIKFLWVLFNSWFFGGC